MAFSPKHTPAYVTFREGVEATDTIADVTKKQGINMEGFDKALIQVIPSGGADPTVKVYWWSEAAGKFIREHTEISRAGVGADTPFEFSVDCNGRIMFVAVTTLAGGAVGIAVAGYGYNDRG